MIPGMSLIEDQISLYNARRSGSEYNTTTLQNAIYDIGNIETVLYIPKGETDTQTVWEITTDIIFPENITVFIPCGVVLNIHAGQIVGFNGKLINQCPIWHIGSGNILLNRKTAITDQSFSDFFNPFVVSGGIHGLSPTCYSPNFGTEAYVSNGLFIREYANKNIHYGNVGANCLDDKVWVIISGNEGPTIPGTNFVNVPDSQYYIDFTSTTLPTLPPNSCFLMEVTLLNDQITKVSDMRPLDAVQGMLTRILPLSWSPALYPGSYVYSTQTGVYMRLGRLLYVTASIKVASINSAGSGPVAITGLPYSEFIYGTGGASFNYIRGIRPGAGPGSFGAIIYPGTSWFYFTEMIIGSYDSVFVDTSRILPGFEMSLSGTYIIYV